MLTKPPGSLGRLEDIVDFLAAWQGKPTPRSTGRLSRCSRAITASSNKGVSAYPASVTRAMMDNFAGGGAAINQICAAYGIGLKVFDLALDVPTKDITKAAALEEKEAAATFAFGMEAIAGECRSFVPRRNGHRQYDRRGRHLPRRSMEARRPIGWGGARESMTGAWRGKLPPWKPRSRITRRILRIRLR